jgi:hypothetical protein
LEGVGQGLGAGVRADGAISQKLYGSAKIFFFSFLCSASISNFSSSFRCRDISTSATGLEIVTGNNSENVCTPEDSACKEWAQGGLNDELVPQGKRGACPFS